MDKQEVLRKLSNFSYNRARLREIQEQLNSITYKVTPTYGNLSGTSGGGFGGSKVESMGNRRHDLKQAARGYSCKVAEVYRMIERSGLEEKEKALMWWIANNGKLQAFARREKIGKDNVYKIRDRAIKKIIAACMPHNER